MPETSLLAAFPWPDLHTPLSTASALSLGLALGLRHAVEADHVAAVAVIASERRGLLGASLVGGLWGVGHTCALLAAGVAVIMLGLPLSASASAGFETLVALTLIALGARALYKLARGGWRDPSHAQGEARIKRAHVHAGDAVMPGARRHQRLRLSSGARPLLIGALHDLAGSAALMLLVVPAIPSRASAMLFLTIFGAGSIGGMMLMSALVALPARLAGRHYGERASFFVHGAAGLLSLAFGALLLAHLAGLVAPAPG